MEVNIIVICKVKGGGGGVERGICKNDIPFLASVATELEG
jgi:hypothetical protein